MLVLLSAMLVGGGGCQEPSGTQDRSRATGTPPAVQNPVRPTSAPAADPGPPTRPPPDTPTALRLAQSPSANYPALSALAAQAAAISPALAEAFAGAFTGTSVTILGPLNTEDAAALHDSFRDFERFTGIDIQYERSPSFEAILVARVDQGNAPDIVDFPQPGLAAHFARDGRIVDVATFIRPAWLEQNYAQSYREIATLEGPNGPIMAGIWHRVSPKSLVWYPKAAFDQAGYTVPQTWAELRALMDQMVADGHTPWCIGIESGPLTGWVAADWTEDLLLRTTTRAHYDQWARGTLPFTDPIVTHAVTAWSAIWFNDQYVYGGRAAIVSTNFSVAPTPMFATPNPRCWLHKQGSFITDFFPPGRTPGTDYSVFSLPPIRPADGTPVLFSGSLMVVFNDRPEVRAVAAFLSSGASVERWVNAGGVVAPHRDAHLAWYHNALDRAIADIMYQADYLRVGRADLMPTVGGAEPLWEGLRAYIVGTVDLDTMLEQVQARWPGP